MTTTLTATFDGRVLIPLEQVDLPTGTALRVSVELPRPPGGRLADLEACGIWADRTDLQETTSAARQLRRQAERRENHVP